jgi:hypothetical protein
MGSPVAAVFSCAAMAGALGPAPARRHSVEEETEEI